MDFLATGFYSSVARLNYERFGFSRDYRSMTDDNMMFHNMTDSLDDKSTWETGGLLLREYGAYDKNGHVYSIAKPSSHTDSSRPLKTFSNRQEIEKFVNELVFLKHSYRGDWSYILSDNEFLSDDDQWNNMLNGKPYTIEAAKEYIVDLINSKQLGVFPVGEWIPPEARNHNKAAAVSKQEEYIPAGGPGDRPATLGPEPVGSVQRGNVVPKRTPKFFNLRQMDQEYIGEETGAVWGTKVKYLNDVERQQYQLHIKDGKFYDAEDNLFDTSAAKSAFGGQGNAVFVMDKYGSIYASSVHSPGKFHHSSFLAGQPVASAGEIVVDNGVLRAVTRRSGHYQPTAEQLEQFLQKLGGSGINLNKVNVGAGF